ncbi:hypothetical protein HYX11_01515 [Candidatus Woesearchaeota archaeon]|nr:hypothetical protein [Candidatus Woesearchaeota archaeon]
MKKDNSLTLDEVLALAKRVSEWEFNEYGTLEAVTDRNEDLRYIDISIGCREKDGKKHYWLDCATAYIDGYFGEVHLGGYEEEIDGKEPQISQLYRHLSKVFSDKRGDYDYFHGEELRKRKESKKALIRAVELRRLRKLINS